jgi:hypothetical protein
MKQIILILLLLSGVSAMSQNVGIGTTDPRSKLHMVGSFLINAPMLQTSAAPLPGQTHTMVNSTSISINGSDSTARIYDPGGAAGNYNSNLAATAVIGNTLSNAVGIEITLEDVELGTGDSLIIQDVALTTLLAVGNNYTTTGKWVFNLPQLVINFKSNNDANNGRGFILLMRRLYNNTASMPQVSDFVGNSFWFDVKNGAVRGGSVGNVAVGPYSVALGNKPRAFGISSVSLGNATIASGDGAVALGNSTIASGTSSVAAGGSTDATGDYAVAMGIFSEATADNAVAIGDRLIASGLNSLALGTSSIATGDYAIAIGREASATGDRSFALGNYVSTNGWAGSFTLGDGSTTNVMNTPAANNFRARFANGYRLYTSADYSTSCSLGAGDNAWTTTSDVRLKENFAPVDGEDILRKIAAMPLVTWNYKKQDPARFRHYGPMAQDFHAAFGRDIYGAIGNDTTINQSDFAGVSFIGIQALAKQNTALKSTLALLMDEIMQLKAIQQRQQKELDTIKKRKITR